MSTSSPYQPLTPAQQEEGSPPTTTGFGRFAGAVMLVAGIWHVLLGISAIAHDGIYVATAGYLYSFDLTGWGWIHLVVGVVVAAVGIAVLLGQTWAAVFGMILAGLSLLGNFLFLPWYPLWSLAIMGLDALIIWALARYQFG
jgi:hypothetical protein